MSTILTIYSHNAFKRFLLPATNEAYHTITLGATLFDLAETLDLQLEITGNEWYFRRSEDYSLSFIRGDGSCYDVPLSKCAENGSAVKVIYGSRHILSVIVSVMEDYFSVYDHYDLSALKSPVQIGRDEKNTISISREGSALSASHAVIFENGGRMYLQDNGSANGTFLNNRRIEGATALIFGDCIDIFGLRIVFLGDQIAVNTRESGAVVKEDQIRRFCPAGKPPAQTNHRSLRKLFHRSPRHIAHLESDAVKIEEPPQPHEDVRQRGILAAIGAALSMALPMLLGCSFMIIASRMSGMNRGVFMYVGLVTAGTSAILGTIRSITAMKNAREEYVRYEKARGERYGEYLNQQEALIRAKYTKNRDALFDRYRSAAECCSYSADNALLWNRNSSQEDYLTHRLGIGDIPFQAPIEIPEKKFSMVENNLQEMPAHIKARYETLSEVPVCVDLLKEKLIGIVGGSHRQGCFNVIRNLVTQIITGNAYTDVKLIFVYDDKMTDLSKQWSFVRWLPHVWNETQTFRYVASNKDEASEVFYELNMELRKREENAEAVSAQKRDTIPSPYYVLVLGSPELLNGELVSKYVYEKDPHCGLTTVFLSERVDQLPNSCEFIIENDDHFRGMYHISDDDKDKIGIRFDECSDAEIDLLAQRLANIEVSGTETGGDIPASIGFFEMYGVAGPEELAVLNRWKKNRTYESMRALIGIKAGGAPCYLDIHEKYHGPHGLVAGTTGSGKSETLQTYILSLSVNFSPDDIGFFIIDYKGGGMANLFENLPHLVGQISNLSGNQIQRALVSIRSEKDRRELIFKEYGVKDIRDYTKLYKSGEATLPLPHLVIVIDEFAEMKQDEPEFIQEVVSISRVGRSLGIHLIMATQKPAGSVSDDIWSNSRFKLCLRVQSRQDSMDMLHKPDAAYLTQAGRTYLQVGNDELYELFQSGYSGAVYEEDGSGRIDIATMLETNGLPALQGNHARLQHQREKKLHWIGSLLQEIRTLCPNGADSIREMQGDERLRLTEQIFRILKRDGFDYPVTENNRGNLMTLLTLISECGFNAEAIIARESDFTNNKNKLPQEQERTQLEAMIAYLQETAQANGYTHDFSLFLPLLPVLLALEKLPQQSLAWNDNTVFNGERWPEHSGEWTLQTGIGMYDDPENQRQDTLIIDPARDGNIVLFGAASTGKTTFLQSVIYGLIYRYSPAEINLYLMEFSARKLSCFENAPHVGGIIRDDDDPDRIDKFFTLLARLLRERKNTLGDLSYAQYAAAYGLGKIPAVVIIVDNYASLLARTGEKYHDFILRLLKEGIGNGIFMIASAQGTGGSEMPNAMAANFQTPICLEMNNDFDYANLLRVSSQRLYPESGIKGRGLAYVGERILEFQTAIPLIEKLDNEVQMGEEIRAAVENMRKAWKGVPARKIPEIPEEPIWSEFAELPEVQTLLADDRSLPIGYDAKLADVCSIDLSKVFTFVISGARKKGKTNFLKAAILSASAKNSRIVIVDYASQLNHVAEATGAAHLTSEESFIEWLKTFKEEIKARNSAKYELSRAGADEETIYQSIAGRFDRIFLFIDDIPEVIEKAYAESDDKPRYWDLLELVFDKCALHNVFCFFTANKEEVAGIAGRRLYRLMVRDKKGIHFGGMTHNTAIAELNFANHNRRTLDDMRPVGRGMFPTDNESDVLEVVIPQVRGSER